LLKAVRFWGVSGAATNDANTAARAATKGRRAHHKCRVEICPLRIDFSRAASTEISRMGMKSSMRRRSVVMGTGIGLKDLERTMLAYVVVFAEETQQNLGLL